MGLWTISCIHYEEQPIEYKDLSSSSALILHELLDQHLLTSITCFFFFFFFVRVYTKLNLNLFLKFNKEEKGFSPKPKTNENTRYG